MCIPSWHEWEGVILDLADFWSSFSISEIFNSFQWDISIAGYRMWCNYEQIENSKNFEIEVNFWTNVNNRN